MIDGNQIQRLIERATTRQRVAEQGLQRKSRTLVLESPPYGQPKQPPIYDDTPAPTVLTARQQSRMDQAQALADAVVAQLDPARRAALVALVDADRSAAKALADARAQLVTLAAPPAADADLEVLTSQESRRAALVRLVPTLEARALVAAKAFGEAIDDVRADLVVAAEGTALRQSAARRREIEEQIEALEREAVDRELAESAARSLLRSFGAATCYPLV